MEVSCRGLSYYISFASRDKWKGRSAGTLPYQIADFTMISGNDALQRLRVAFAKETTLYMGRLRLPPMVDDLTVGINE